MIKQYSNRKLRKLRSRKSVLGSTSRPRLSVFRSNRAIYVQLIDDTLGKTILTVSSKDLTKEKVAPKAKPVEKARILGEIFAKKAKQKKIAAIVFDRSGYKYHGQVKAFAEGVRKNGVKF